MPSRDFTSEDLFSSRMISMHSSTHSSQMKTVGPAISLRTSCWLLPQNEQSSVFLGPLVPTLLILVFVLRSNPLLDRPIPALTRPWAEIEQNPYQERPCAQYSGSNQG